MSEQRPDLGTFCTFRQATFSDTANRLGIDNVPNDAQWANMVATYTHVIEPIMLRFGQLPITSFFRCPDLNKAVGGSTTSAHMLGQACDIDGDGTPTSNEQIVAWARKNLVFDQLILEYPDKNGKPSWVHISYRTKGKNRGQVLRARRATNGKTVYDNL